MHAASGGSGCSLSEQAIWRFGTRTDRSPAPQGSSHRKESQRFSISCETGRPQLHGTHGTQLVILSTGWKLFVCWWLSASFSSTCHRLQGQLVAGWSGGQERAPQEPPAAGSLSQQRPLPSPGLCRHVCDTETCGLEPSQHGHWGGPTALEGAGPL